VTERSYATEESIPGTEPYSVVVRQLGAGGHGTVYLVRHVYLTKKRAVMKVLHANLSDRKDLADRMEREAQTLAGMDHRNIVGVIDAGLTAETPPRPYFVMEYLRGESLRHLIAAGGVGFKSAIKVAIEVADALEYAHTKHGVIHRDIKPDNIFIQVASDDTAITKLLDFGVMHMLALEKRQAGQHIIGTPQYMAPEQLAGKKPTPAADLYALGLVLYEMLTGKGPFDDETSLIAIGEAHLRRQPPELNVYRLPQSLKDLVKALLAKDPRARPQSAAGVATALRQIRRELEAEYGAPIDERSKTDPTPMENRLVARRGEIDATSAPTAAGGDRVVATHAHDTQRADLQVPQGGSTLENADPIAVTESMHPLEAVALEGAGRPREGVGPAVDRTAITRSMIATPALLRPRSWTDTEEIPAEPSWSDDDAVEEARDRDEEPSRAPRPAAGRAAREKRSHGSVAGVASSIVVPLGRLGGSWRVASIALALFALGMLGVTGRALLKRHATAPARVATEAAIPAPTPPTPPLRRAPRARLSLRRWRRPRRPRRAPPLPPRAKAPRLRPRW
jgi:serine/threonine protein kinase